MKTGNCCLPFFEVKRTPDDTVVEGNDVADVLVFASSWPSMLRTVYDDQQRGPGYVLETFSRLPHHW